MENKLISMVDYVLDLDKKASMGGAYDKIVKHANFLQQKPELGMFVPCDEDGVLLSEPNGYDVWIAGIVSDSNEFTQYQQAQERVIFDGFEKLSSYCVKNDKFIIYFLNNVISLEEHFEDIITKTAKTIHTIEDLVKYNLILK